MYYELGTQSCLSKAKEESSKEERCALAASPCVVSSSGGQQAVARQRRGPCAVPARQLSARGSASWCLRVGCALGARCLCSGSAGLAGPRPVQSPGFPTRDSRCDFQGSQPVTPPSPTDSPIEATNQVATIYKDRLPSASIVFKHPSNGLIFGPSGQMRPLISCIQEGQFPALIYLNSARSLFNSMQFNQMHPDRFNGFDGFDGFDHFDHFDWPQQGGQNQNMEQQEITLSTS